LRDENPVNENSVNENSVTGNPVTGNSVTGNPVNENSTNFYNQPLRVFTLFTILSAFSLSVFFECIF
jgi:hypothetical protein